MRDVRIKNIYGVSGYQPPEDEDEEDEAEKIKSHEDMTADVFKIEGAIVRELVMAMNGKNMKWLKAEFKKVRE